jgi:hypothetical protein
VPLNVQCYRGNHASHNSVKRRFAFTYCEVIQQAVQQGVAPKRLPLELLEFSTVHLRRVKRVSEYKLEEGGQSCTQADKSSAGPTYGLQVHWNLQNEPASIKAGVTSGMDSSFSRLLTNPRLLHIQLINSLIAR